MSNWAYFPFCLLYSIRPPHFLFHLLWQYPPCIFNRFNCYIWYSTFILAKSCHHRSHQSLQSSNNQKISWRGLKLPPSQPTFPPCSLWMLMYVMCTKCLSSKDSITLRGNSCEIRDFSFHVIWIPPAMWDPLCISYLHWDGEQLITFYSAESFYMLKAYVLVFSKTNSYSVL